LPPRSLTYDFDELPLIMTGGMDACHVTGFAEIRYDASGAWSIERIGFEAVKWAAPTSNASAEALRAGRPQRSFERRKTWLDIGDPLHTIVYGRLEQEWRSRVQRRVDDQIFDDRNSDSFCDRGADHVTALIKEQA
jgi:hypothetical protein